MHSIQIKKHFVIVALLVAVSSLFASIAYAQTENFGDITITDTLGEISKGDTTVTICASTGFSWGGTTKTNNITLTNSAGSKATLSFNFSATSANTFSLTIAGKSYTNSPSGQYSVDLGSGESLAIVLTSTCGRLSSSSAKLVLSNLTLTPIIDSATVSFKFESSLGSVKVDGTSIESGTSKTITGDGATLVATPVSGATFVGWMNADTKELLKTDATWDYLPTGNVTIQAVFASADSSAWFLVDQKYLYNDLTTATTKGTTIVLAANGTLPSGEYTIPSTDTLLIPFDAGHTLYTTTPECQDAGGITAYRTLTLAENAKITVNGAISLSAKHKITYASYAGSYPSGNVSYINMSEGSEITLGSTGALYAYGYIVGDGKITATSGSVVYEMFQVSDYRGGNATSNSSFKTNKVFPLSQYYVQNITVPLTLQYGAKEYVYMTLYASGNRTICMPFIGADASAMFNLSSGSVTKWYDGSEDRLYLEINGDFSIDSAELVINEGGILGIGEVKVNSADYVLPINSNITVDLKTGTINVNSDIALLPGTVFKIAKGTTATLGTDVNVYVYDKDQWGTYCYYDGGMTTLAPVYSKHPEKVKSRTDADLIDAIVEVNGTLDASKGHLYTTVNSDGTSGGASICSTGNGKVILGTVADSAKTYQAAEVEGGFGDGINVVSAWLQHADESYLVSVAGTTYYYHPGCGKWGLTADASTSVVTEPTCTVDGYTTYTCEEHGSTQNNFVDKLGHDEIQHEAKAPSCTEIGWDAYVTCSRCDYTTYVELLAKGHTEVTDAAEAASCTTAGKTAGSHCSVCNEVIVAQEEIPATGHSYSLSESVDATCTSDGSTTYTCNNCGDSYTKTSASAGHSYTSSTVEPTCTETGSITETCSVCGDTKTETVSALGHTEVTDKAVDATCTDTGLTAGKHCSVCGEVIVAQEEVPAKGHSMGDWTDNQDGTKTRVCKNNCGESETLLSATATEKYYVQDFLYYNATIPFASDPGTVTFCKPDGSDISGFEYVYDSANKLLYIMRMLPSDEIMTDYAYVIVVGDVRSETFTVSFANYAEGLGSDSEHQAVAQAITQYGNAASTYFGDGDDITSISAVLDKEPGNNSLTTDYGATDSAFDTYGASVIFDERIALKIYFSGSLTFETEKYEYQLGILRGNADSPELTTALANSGACSAIIAYNTLSDTSVSSGSGVPAAVTGTFTYPSNMLSSVNLAKYPSVVFNLDSTEYGDRFAIRAFLVVREKGSETATVYYGRQVVYGLEDYVSRMLARSKEELIKLDVDKPIAFKEFLIEAWNYALAAETAFS